MKIVKVSLLIGFIYSIALIFGNSQAIAQCVACYQSANGNCDTEIVNRDGASGCGCDTGCSCTGQCKYGPGSGDMMILDDEVIFLNIPEDGLVYESDLLRKTTFFETFIEGGYVGEEKISNVLFGEKHGAYVISDSEIVLFPLKDDSFDLKNCNGELMASISKNPL